MNISSYYKSEQGEGILTALYSMLILTIVFFIGIDIAGYTAASWKLRNACSETLMLMKKDNGFDGSTKDRFIEYIALQGLEPSKVSVWGTPKLVNRGDIVSIQAVMPYPLKALKPFNQEINFNIRVEMSGLAQEFLRGSP